MIVPLREIVQKTILPCGYTTVSEFLKEPWWVISSVQWRRKDCSFVDNEQGRLRLWNQFEAKRFHRQHMCTEKAAVLVAAVLIR